MENHKLTAIHKSRVQKYCMTHPFLPPKPPAPKPVWFSSSKPGEEVLQLKEEALVTEISFKNMGINGPIKCGLHFFNTIARFCTKHSSVPLNIPETLIFGYGFEIPTLLYTDSSGLLRTKSKLNHAQLDTLQQILECHRLKTKKQFPSPLVLLKSPNPLFNKVLLRGSEFHNEVKNGFKSDILLQRYIMPKGNKACKIRVVWEEGIGNRYYSITNKLRFDGKAETRKKKKESHEELDSSLAETGEVERNKTANRPFGMKRQSQAKRINLHRSDSEVIQLAQKFLHEKNLAGQLVELGNPELYSSFTNHEHIERKDSKELSSPTLENIQKLSSSPILESSPKEKPKPRATRERLNTSFSISTFFEPQSIESLYKKLYAQDNCNIRANNDSEENVQSTLAAKLRSSYCIDINGNSKVLIFEINANSTLNQVDQMLETLKRAINRKYLLIDNKHISKLVCDFCEDANMNFYILKIKYYYCKTHETHIEVIRSREAVFDCPGKYCYREENFPSEDTKKIESSQARPRIYKIFRKTLMENQEEDIEEILKPIYHNTVDVCENCFHVYMKKEKEILDKNKKREIKNAVSVDKFRFSQPIGVIKVKSFKMPSINKQHRSRASTGTTFLKNKKGEVLDACRSIEFE